MTENLLFVIDLNCRNKPREHVIIVNGIEITVVFNPGKTVEMPFAHAVKFLIPGFSVSDAYGVSLVSPGGKNENGKSATILKNGEIIANLRELTNESLCIRANQISGGEKFHKAHKKDLLITFLTNHLKDARSLEPVLLDKYPASDDLKDECNADDKLLKSLE